MKKISLILSLSLFVISAHAKTLKIATIAPEASEWVSIAKEMLKKIEDAGKGTKIILYTGGVMGDEPDMLRKIGLGQLSGAGFSGLGLGKIVPAVRILELPLIFKNYDEVDYAVKKMRPIFEKMFEEKGYKLVLWAEQGFIYVFTNKKIEKLEDFRGVKMWVWSQDPLASEIFKVLSDYLSPVPLGVPELLTSLQTGIVNAFYAPPLAALSLQWFSRVKYMLNVPFTYGIGGVVFKKSEYDSLTVEEKERLTELVKVYEPKIIESARKANESAIKGFSDYGLQVVDVPQKGLDEVREKMGEVYRNLMGNLYSKELYDTLMNVINEYRSKKQ